MKLATRTVLLTWIDGFESLSTVHHHIGETIRGCLVEELWIGTFFLVVTKGSNLLCTVEVLGTR